MINEVKNKIYTKNDCGKSMTIEDNRKVLIDMLDELVKFCNENNLYYTLSGGTLLGAIRHKGFIPWDDDIDVNMPRPDIVKLVEISNCKIGIYDLIKPGDDKFTGSFYRLYDTRTIMENSLGIKNNKKIYNPIFIDIFPVEGLPKNKFQQKVYYFISSILRKIMRVSQRDNISAKKYSQLILNIIGYIPAKLIGYKRLVSIFQEFIQKYDFNQAEYVGVMSASKYTIEEIIDRIGYLKPISVEFEKKMYQGPFNYDKYLSQLYGDYMKLPPIEKQKTHHIFNVYWRKA